MGDMRSRGSCSLVLGGRVAVSVALSYSLLDPQLSGAAPCDAQEAERAYEEALDGSLDDERRIEVAIDGLAHSEECDESASARQSLAIILLNTALGVTQGEWDREGLSRALCEGIEAARLYQSQREAIGAPRDPDVQSRIDQLAADPGIVEACAEPAQTTVVSEPTEGPPAKDPPRPAPRALDRIDVRAGVGLVSLGAAGLAVGGVFSILVAEAEDKRRHFGPEGACNDYVICPDLAGTGQRRETVQYVAYGIGATLAIVGLATLSVGLARHKRRAQRLIALGGLSFQWTF